MSTPGRSLRFGYSGSHTPNPRFARCTLIALLLTVLLFTALRAVGEEQDPRSTEILRYGCSNEFARREITLFANGTVRLREGPWESQTLSLDELSPEAVAENLRVLRGIYGQEEADETRQPTQSLSGIWVEQCVMYLALPEVQEPLHYEFTSYDIPPLLISRIIHLADDLARYTRPVRPEVGIPKSYTPKFGDVLRTAEGHRYEVLRLTDDQRGVELEGLDQPLRIYVALDDLSEAFIAVEEAEERSWWWRQ